MQMTTTAILKRIGKAPLTTSVNVGTPAPAVTRAVEYGDGHNHTTVLTISQLAAVTSGDNVSLSMGELIYTFPAGEIVVNSSHLDLLLTNAEHDTETPDTGLGTTIGSGANATITSAQENIMVGATNTIGTQLRRTSGLQLVIPASGGVAHAVFINLALAWADTAGSALDVDMAGTVVLNWTYLTL